MPSAYEGTDIISYLQGKYIIRQRRISYRVSDISLKSAAFYDMIPLKEGAFMSENKLLHSIKDRIYAPFRFSYLHLRTVILLFRIETTAQASA